MEPDKVKRAPNVMALVSHFNQVRSACGWRASSSVLLTRVPLRFAGSAMVHNANCQRGVGAQTGVCHGPHRQDRSGTHILGLFPPMSNRPQSHVVGPS